MTTIKLKNGSGAPVVGDLVQGEPALDLTNNRLYTEDAGGVVIEVGTNPTSLTTGAITSTGVVTATSFAGDGSALTGLGLGIDDNAVATSITIDAAGLVGINAPVPTEVLNVGGNILATGDITAYSDERLKSDINTLDGSKVYAMRGVSFTKDGEASSGVIAQEIQKVAPELVNESGEYLSVAYGNLVGYLIEAVKSLKEEVDQLKGQQ